MTVIHSVVEGKVSLYDIPDSELAKYDVKAHPITDEERARLFPGKDTLTRDDAHGMVETIPAGGGGDVEGYGATANICWYTYHPDWGYWYC
ncbi:MAG: hypothetical protein QOE48_5015 [Mycobacterium sp.]|jgi:hypothetical protein|nr:hypothetical protein [Mycobacterium sp.]